MTTGAPRPNWSAIAFELTHDERTAIHTSTQALGLDPDRWMHVPALDTFATTLAFERLRQRLRVRGMPAERARLTAAETLGVNVERVTRTLRRWRRLAP